MENSKRHHCVTLSLFFLATFFLTQLSFLTADSFALDNSTLNGTYAYAEPMSAFKDADVNGGFGATDIEYVGRGDIVLDGSCTKIHASNPELMSTGNLDGN